MKAIIFIFFTQVFANTLSVRSGLPDEFRFLVESLPSSYFLEEKKQESIQFERQLKSLSENDRSIFLESIITKMVLEFTPAETNKAKKLYTTLSPENAQEKLRKFSEDLKNNPFAAWILKSLLSDLEQVQKGKGTVDLIEIKKTKIYRWVSFLETNSVEDIQGHFSQLAKEVFKQIQLALAFQQTKPMDAAQDYTWPEFFVLPKKPAFNDGLEALDGLKPPKEDNLAQDSTPSWSPRSESAPEDLFPPASPQYTPPAVLPTPTDDWHLPL